MTISDEQGFVARLRITEVDINRSVGVVELEQRSVEQRDRVIAVPRG